MKKTITIECAMEERWIPSFCAMLKWMQRNGEIGHSEYVGIYSDGDGDFRPNFTWFEKINLNDTIKVSNPSGQMVMFDAG